MSGITATEGHSELPRVAVVIPCYRVGKHLAGVVNAIGPEVWRIYCVDDGCPENSREVIEGLAAENPRLQGIFHAQNQGVGAAVVTGYQQAIAEGADILVKLDGDGQMDPARIPELIEPLLRGEADYVKGNRFFDLDSVKAMPVVRLIGNAGLSFLSKISSGYWNLFDPTNGYTAIQASIARQLPLHKVSPRYFFESDMLFRLNTLRAVVLEIPMAARYADETSNLSVTNALGRFPLYHARNFFKRIFYNYYLRGFSIASVNLFVGSALLAFGVIFGASHWIASAESNVFASPGTVMVAALPIILGTQLVLSFVSFDIENVPRDPIHRRIRANAQKR